MSSLRNLYAELLNRQRTLTYFGLAMALLMVPVLVISGLDDRLIRGSGVWAKPLKFMASTALLAISAAWFFGLLPAAQRTSRQAVWLVRVIVVTSLFEVAYISFQASLGQGSHYNTGDPFHRLMFGLMAMAAFALTASQAWLACLIARYTIWPFSAWTLSVVLGLALTFVLGTASGFMLGANQPPAGVGLPVVGWHVGAVDIRPAHFLGVHAQQLLPLAGLCVTGLRPVVGRILVVAFAAGYLLLWIGAVKLAS